MLNYITGKIQNNVIFVDSTFYHWNDNTFLWEKIMPEVYIGNLLDQNGNLSEQEKSIIVNNELIGELKVLLKKDGPMNKSLHLFPLNDNTVYDSSLEKCVPRTREHLFTYTYGAHIDNSVDEPFPTSRSSDTHHEAWNYLLQLMGNDKDQVIDLLQTMYQWMQMVNDKIVFFVGDGSNGKSVWLKVIQRLFGKSSKVVSSLESDILAYLEPHINLVVLEQSDHVHTNIDKFSTFNTVSRLIVCNYICDDAKQSDKCKVINFPTTFVPVDIGNGVKADLNIKEKLFKPDMLNVFLSMIFKS